MSPPTVTSSNLIEKAISAAISAIELYNKPDFKYREETFAILMTNAWELLLKAKVLKDAGEDFDALVAKDKSGKPKLTRSENPLTHEITYLARQLSGNAANGVTLACLVNIELLVEVRDSSIHFVNCDLHFSKRVQDIGTAALKNFLGLAQSWFSVDLSRYNFYLMPISFFHGFEAAEPASLSSYSEQMRRLLLFIREQEKAHTPDDIGAPQVTVCIKTEFARSQSDAALEIRLTNNPTAPEMQMKEEDVRKRWPFTYDELVTRCRQRYTDFKTDPPFMKLKREMETKGERFCHARFLDPSNPKPPGKRFYSSDVLSELDKHYTRAAAKKSA